VKRHFKDAERYWNCDVIFLDELEKYKIYRIAWMPDIFLDMIFLDELGKSRINLIEIKDEATTKASDLVVVFLCSSYSGQLDRNTGKRSTAALHRCCSVVREH